MGNLFIGFPVPRAKIATMIEEAAPPLEHVDNHLPYGTDPIVDPLDISENQIVTWNGTKFVGSEAPAPGLTLSPISVPPSGFNPKTDLIDYTRDFMELSRRSDLGVGQFIAPIFFPHGVTVSKLTLNAYREDADSSLLVHLKRVNNVGGDQIMAVVTADWTDGDGSVEDTSIDNAVTDNTLYSYCLDLYINPNDSVGDVILWNMKIHFS